MIERWDLIIIGAGPAGLTAGIYASRSGLKVLIIEEKIPGGLALEAPIIENYPGFPESISGSELISRMVKQAEAFGAEIHQMEKATKLDLFSDEKKVETTKAEYHAPAIIIATGCTHRKLGVQGEEEFRGRGVSYCALCDGPLFRGKKVAVVGGGNAAAISALYLSKLASNVKLIHRRNKLRADEYLFRELVKEGVEILWNSEVKEIRGDEFVRSILICNNFTGEISEIQVNGVFICVGEVPNSEIAREAGVEVDERGFIKIDLRQRTNIVGVYACGDVTNYPVKQIGTAVGQGIVAAMEAYGYVKRPYYYKG